VSLSDGEISGPGINEWDGNGIGRVVERRNLLVCLAQAWLFELVRVKRRKKREALPSSCPAHKYLVM